MKHLKTFEMRTEQGDYSVGDISYYTIENSFEVINDIVKGIVEFIVPGYRNSTERIYIFNWRVEDLKTIKIFNVGDFVEVHPEFIDDCIDIYHSNKKMYNIWKGDDKFLKQIEAYKFNL